MFMIRLVSWRGVLNALPAPNNTITLIILLGRLGPELGRMLQ